jgi:hypothetical protein
MQRYIEQRIEPGGFLLAVLRNDFRYAVERADVHNAPRLLSIVRWLYNHAPAPCWGSAEKVGQWLY